MNAERVTTSRLWVLPFKSHYGSLIQSSTGSPFHSMILSFKCSTSFPICNAGRALPFECSESQCEGRGSPILPFPIAVRAILFERSTGSPILIAVRALLFECSESHYVQGVGSPIRMPWGGVLLQTASAVHMEGPPVWMPQGPSHLHAFKESPIGIEVRVLPFE